MDKECLTRTAGRTYAVWLYTVGLTVPFLFGILLTFGVPDSVYYQDVFYVLHKLFMTGLAVYLWTVQPERKRMLPAAMWVLVAAFLWTIFRFVFDRELFMQHNPEFIWNRAYEAWFLFFPCALLLTREELGRCLRALALVWGGGMGIAAALGIYCTATNSRYFTPIGSIIGIVESGGVYRLRLSNYPTTSAEGLLIAAAFVMLAVFASKQKWQKLCFGVLLLPLYVAMGLTDGRSAMIAFGLLCAIAVFIRVLLLPIKRDPVRYGAGLAAAVLTAVLTYGVCGHISGYFHVDVDALPTCRSSGLVTQEPKLLAAGDYTAPPGAPGLSFLMAVPEEEGIVIHRQIESTLSGRTELWKATFRALASNDENILLVGRTPCDFETVLYAHGFPKREEHVHNTYLQVVVEWGLPGLALMLTFLALLAVASFRLMLRDGLPFWERFLPAPVLALLAVELVDCFMRLNEAHVALQAGFLLMGMTIAVERKTRRAVQ